MTILGLLGQIAANILRGIAISLGIQAAVNFIQSVLAPAGQPVDLALVQKDTVNSFLLLTNVTYGLVAIHDRLVAIENDVSYIMTNMQQAGMAVTLPSPPPSGYGGLDATATGNAVWSVDAMDVRFGTTFGMLYRAAATANSLRTGGVASARAGCSG